MLNFLVPKRWRKDRPQVAVVQLTGIIGMSTPLKPGLTLSNVNTVLEQAFKMRGTKAVALAINSPGGSPVQSTLIHNRIRQLAKKHKKPVYVFAEDVAASGGYMLACSGDEIYADASSIIGSIGVISAGFGFTTAIEKLGIERRVYTSGTRKMMLDAFSPENPDDIKRLKNLQKQIHDNFIALVKQRRAHRLAEKDTKLFTGEFWIGEQARELGLIDGLGDMYGILQQKFGDDVRLRPVSQSRNLLRRLTGTNAPLAKLSDLFSTPEQSLAHDVISAVEARALWQRFGL